MDRRDFLRTAAFLAAGAAALTSVVQPAYALPVVTGVRRSPEEKTFPIPTADGAQIDKDHDLILSRS